MKIYMRHSVQKEKYTVNNSYLFHNMKHYMSSALIKASVFNVLLKGFKKPGKFVLLYTSLCQKRPFDVANLYIEWHIKA